MFFETILERAADKVVVVTGGGSGIGRATAELFNELGCKVIILDYNTEALQALGPEFVSYHVDIRDTAAVKGIFTSIAERFGIPHIVIHCAGIIDDAFITEMKEEQWDGVIDTHLKGAYNITQAYVNQIHEHNLINGDKMFGAIVYVGSVIGLVGGIGQLNYAAAKAGMIGMTATVTRETKGKVRTIYLAPGFAHTQLTAKIPEKVIQKILPLIPAGRFATAEEIAEMIVFLALHPYVNGGIYTVDGGYSSPN